MPREFQELENLLDIKYKSRIYIIYVCMYTHIYIYIYIYTYTKVYFVHI